MGLHTGYTWHSALDTSFQVTFHRLESDMLAKSICIHSDSPFPVGVKMDTNYIVVFQAVSPIANRAFR